MRLLTVCAVLSIAVLLSPAAPVDEKARGDKAAGSSARRAEVRFADGSFLFVTLVSENVEVVTKYGKLTVPLAEVTRIEFGTRLPEEVEKRLKAAAARRRK